MHQDPPTGGFWWFLVFQSFQKPPVGGYWHVFAAISLNGWPLTWPSARIRRPSQAASKVPCDFRGAAAKSFQESGSTSKTVLVGFWGFSFWVFLSFCASFVFFVFLLLFFGFPSFWASFFFAVVFWFFFMLGKCWFCWIFCSKYHCRRALLVPLFPGSFLALFKLKFLILLDFGCFCLLDDPS